MAKKIKIPKRIGSIKVPRGVRKSRLLRGLLNHPMGREIVGSALVAGAGAAAAALVQQREDVADTAKSGARKGGRAGVLVAAAMRDATDAMMGVFSDALQSVAPKQKGKHKQGHKRHRKDDAPQSGRRESDEDEGAEIGLRH